MNFAARLAETGCRMIHVRHEHCAVAAAMACARKSGQVGLATVTCGPGLTEVMSALPAAVRAHLPLVVIAGEAPLTAGRYNQAIDQAPSVRATGAAYVPLHAQERMAVGLRDAFLQARRERRPVVVGVPFDLQNRVRDAAGGLPEPSEALVRQVSPMPPAPQDVARAAALNDRADRVVVMPGMARPGPAPAPPAAPWPKPATGCWTRARCGRGAAAGLGDGRFLGPLFLFLRADAFAPAGEFPDHPRIRCVRQRNVFRDGRVPDPPW